MRLGITFSDFDLLNTVHLAMLKESKKKCDHLIVCLKLDPYKDKFEKNVTSKSVIFRYTQLKDSKYVDEIIPYVVEQDIEDLLRSFKIDVLIMEKKYKNIDFTGKAYCLKKGIEIYYNS